ncbi:MAG TPA: MFS transporter [Solirubrobacteraceae bacterium]|nr:MFS transporter [Solirubrobacteraceae bacterium]
MASTTLTPRTRLRRPSATGLQLFVLAAACFTFVTTETQPVALLVPMARGLHVSESTIGLLMTAYAGVAALSAIPLTVLASRVPRRRLVIVTMATLVVSQLVLGLAPDYATALGARLVGALAHGVYWAVLAQIVASLVPRERVGRATAAVVAGNSVALVAGTPLVSALGALVGWRAAVAMMGAAAFAVVLAMARVLPDVPAASGLAEGRRAMLSRASRHRGVLLVCGVTVLLAFGQFAAFTYLAPLVRAHTGLTGTGLSAVLLAYGAAGVLGVARVGRIADRHPRRALLMCCAAIVLGLALIVAFPHGTPVMVLATLAWGAGFTALPICLQSAVLRVAPDIPDTASALYVVAFQIGIGAGALAGADLLGAHELSTIPAVTLAVFLAGSLLATAARRTFGPEAPRAATRDRPGALSTRRRVDADPPGSRRSAGGAAAGEARRASARAVRGSGGQPPRARARGRH